jgi:hypothetical protein
MTSKWKLCDKIQRMFGIIRMAFLIRHLEKFSGQEEWKFIDYILHKTYFGLGLLARIQRLFGIPLFERQYSTRKRRLNQALEKAKRLRTKTGYTESFSYIAHPKHYSAEDILYLNFITGKNLETIDSSRIFVTPQGREFLSLGGVLEDLRAERGTTLIVLITILTTILGSAIALQILVKLAGLVCSWPVVLKACAILGL